MPTPWSATCANGGFGIDPASVPGCVLETEPGDLLVFNHSIKHSSFGGSGRRRMYTMNFSERYPEDKLPELRAVLGREARFLDRPHPRRGDGQDSRPPSAWSTCSRSGRTTPISANWPAS